MVRLTIPRFVLFKKLEQGLQLTIIMMKQNLWISVIAVSYTHLHEVKMSVLRDGHVENSFYGNFKQIRYMAKNVVLILEYRCV